MRETSSTLVGVETYVSERGDIRPTLCVLLGPEPGRVYPLPTGSTLIGRSEVAAVVVDSEGVSRSHAAIVHHSGQVEILDLGSTNGTRVNGERVHPTPRLLKEGDRVQVGDAVFKFTYQDELEADMQRSLYTSAVSDKLTGVYNRAFFNERWTHACAQSLRTGSPLSVVLLDLDHFKPLNDTYGHAAGDAVLQAAAHTMQSCTRREDTLARYGGEEFVVIVPGAPLPVAMGVAERIRGAVAATVVPFGAQRLGVTVSIGVAARLSGGHETPDATLARADALLYEAKSAGRNCARSDRAA